MAERAPDSPAQDGEPATSVRREAAARIERGVEHYAQGAFDEAVKEFEAALAAQPGNVRAVECLAWSREVVAGRRTLTSGTYATVSEEELDSLGPDGDEPPPLDRSPAAPMDFSAAEPLAPVAALAAAPSKTGRTILGMPSIGNPQTRDARGDQLEEAPDSVTREWSTIQTGQNLPQLDVPELSEDQIANLLELDGGRGLTLSKGPPAPRAAPAAEEEVDEADRTNVRLADRVERVVEMVADAEEPSSPGIEVPVADFEPALTPLSASGVAAGDRVDQTADEAPSMPTNPFVRQRLSEYASPLLSSAARVEDSATRAGGAGAGCVGDSPEPGQRLGHRRGARARGPA